MPIEPPRRGCQTSLYLFDSSVVVLLGDLSNSVSFSVPLVWPKPRLSVKRKTTLTRSVSPYPSNRWNTRTHSVKLRPIAPIAHERQKSSAEHQQWTIRVMGKESTDSGDDGGDGDAEAFKRKMRSREQNRVPEYDKKKSAICGKLRLTVLFCRPLSNWRLIYSVVNMISKKNGAAKNATTVPFLFVSRVFFVWMFWTFCDRKENTRLAKINRPQNCKNVKHEKKIKKLNRKKRTKQTNKHKGRQLHRS